VRGAKRPQRAAELLRALDGFGPVRFVRSYQEAANEGREGARAPSRSLELCFGWRRS